MRMNHADYDQFGLDLGTEENYYIEGPTILACCDDVHDGPVVKACFEIDYATLLITGALPSELK